ncbi:MAG: hypothetical protein ACLUQ6_06630 [Alistipes onderdonkii]
MGALLSAVGYVDVVHPARRGGADPASSARTPASRSSKRAPASSTPISTSTATSKRDVPWSATPRRAA